LALDLLLEITAAANLTNSSYRPLNLNQVYRPLSSLTNYRVINADCDCTGVTEGLHF